MGVRWTWMVLGLFLGTPVVVVAADPPAAVLPSADELLRGIDANLTFESRSARVRMTVTSDRRTREYVMQTFGRGVDQAAVEYLEPARDKGTRMLRLGEELWTYMPSVDRVQKISGQMLRQGLMGSDMSYEDLMGAAKLREAYEAKVVAAEELGGVGVWRVELTARDPSVAYPRRVAWVDRQTRVPLKQELYAVSGMLLKTWEMSEVKSFEGGRRFPTRMVVRDHLREGSSTTIVLEELKFSVQLDEEIFSKRWLERR
jgi:outer membrane lipoprotein-sorting protein